MTTTVRAKFDGRSFVPEGPVDIPAGESVTLHIERQKQIESSDVRPLAALAAMLRALPPIEVNRPTDLAAEHDHYLYGTPRRSQKSADGNP